jgi:hypothetical protein
MIRHFGCAPSTLFRRFARRDSALNGDSAAKSHRLLTHNQGVSDSRRQETGTFFQVRAGIGRREEIGGLAHHLRVVRKVTEHQRLIPCDVQRLPNVADTALVICLLSQKVQPVFPSCLSANDLPDDPNSRFATFWRS